MEATPARSYDEVAATKTMIRRTHERLHLKPDRIAADTAYGTGRLLGWLVEQNITPHIPVWDKSNRDDGTLSRADFSFDKEGDVYICPMGKRLARRLGVDEGALKRWEEDRMTPRGASLSKVLRFLVRAD